MHQCVSWTSALVVASVLMQAVAAAVGQVPEAQATPACGSTWESFPAPTALRDARDIASIASDDVWIVGSRKSRGSAVETAAIHWDGEAWRLISIPNRLLDNNQQNALNGVDAAGGRDVWAVGYSLIDDAYKTLVVHWDGSSWRVEPSPNVGEQSWLTAVAAIQSNEAWAVGYSRAGRQRKALILHWGGRSWEVVASPDLGSTTSALLDVEAENGGDAWAVGYKSTDRGLRSLVLRHNGTAWHEIETPAFGTSDNVLTSVAVAADNEVWVAGYYIEGARYQPLTLRAKGNGWERVQTDTPGDNLTILLDIDAASPRDIWVVGFEYDANWEDLVASSQHWDGSRWAAFRSANARLDGESTMSTVDREPGANRTWAAGRSAGHPSPVELICLETEGRGASRPPEETPRDNFPTTEQRNGGATPEPGTQGHERSRSEVANWTAPERGAVAVRAVDAARDAGIFEVTKTYGAVVADFDDDRAPDIFLGRHADEPRLLMNTGNATFEETNRGVFGADDRHECAAVDVNGDRRLDLFCAFGANHGTGFKLNRLYLQEPNHTFVEQGARYGLMEPFTRARNAVFLNANGDAHPDLFTMNEADRGDGFPSHNRLFVNHGEDNGFRDAPEYGLAFEGDGGHASLGDIDGDGWQDLLVAAAPHKYAEATDLLLFRNDAGRRFTEVADAVGLGRSVIDAILVDVDGDGRQDVAALTSETLEVYQNSDGHFSRAFSTAIADGFLLSAGDVNGDGRPDVYVQRGRSGASRNAPDVLYLNDGTGQGFRRMPSLPTTEDGSAESVWPIDYDGNGLTDFLVLNGLHADDPGPVQLIAFFPTGSDPQGATTDSAVTAD